MNWDKMSIRTEEYWDISQNVESEYLYFVDLKKRFQDKGINRLATVLRGYLPRNINSKHIAEAILDQEI